MDFNTVTDEPFFDELATPVAGPEPARPGGGPVVAPVTPSFFELALLGERLQGAILRRELAHRDVVEAVRVQVEKMKAAGLDPAKNYRPDYDRQEMVEV